MPDKDSNILKYNPGEKCMKVLFRIYVDLECAYLKILVFALMILINHQ